MFNNFNSLKAIFNYGQQRGQTRQLNQLSDIVAAPSASDHVVDVDVTAAGVVISGPSNAAARSHAAVEAGIQDGIDALATQARGCEAPGEQRHRSPGAPAGDGGVYADDLESDSTLMGGQSIGPGTRVIGAEVVSVHDAERHGGAAIQVGGPGTWAIGAEVVSIHDAEGHGGAAIQVGPQQSSSSLSLDEIVARPEPCHRLSTSSVSHLVEENGYHTGTDPEAQNEDNRNSRLPVTQNATALRDSLNKVTLCEAAMYLIAFLACFGTLYAAFGPKKN